MHSNALIREKSPYLLQHAHNLVNWNAWGEDAFRQARERDLPIFLSVGYSTCHWCHVMERESFENQAIADLLNRSFVAVKVDREERPDVDRVYMAFVQATTGSGGWPMSVFLTPDLKPFFGGTYWPPEARYGRPGFRQVLERVAEAWRRDRAAILESSRDVLAQLAQAFDAAPAAAVPVESVLEAGFTAFRRGFDPRHGGFGKAPKFPRPAVLGFLLRYAARTGNAEALEMVTATLDAMARGGIRDHLGGGFHRYSVDERWRVPHFEKMLYDQAQLAVAYLEGYQLGGDERYATVARGILDYVLRDMTDPGGGFYSAEDADSEGREGAFYLWSRQEIDAALGPAAAGRFARRYGVQEHGNVLDDPHGEFAGRNILYEADSAVDAAGSEAQLLEVRSRRPRPHRDDKILTAWNGLTISAFAKGAQALEDRRYRDAARAAAEFVLSRLHDGTNATLLRRYRDGEAAIPGFLDDYAFFVQGLLDLYETVFDTRYLDLAGKLTDTQLARFEDASRGGFYTTPVGAIGPAPRMKDDYDGAEPSGNSIAILNLLRLSALLGRPSYREAAERALRWFAPFLAAAPEAAPQMLSALSLSATPPRQIVVLGDRDAEDTCAFLRAIHAGFQPNKALLLVDGDAARRFLSAGWPAIAAMQRVNGAATAYLCENQVCHLPVTDPREIVRSLVG
jgi:uncharacterized protein YyaL (SSP411 family)